MRWRAALAAGCAIVALAGCGDEPSKEQSVASKDEVRQAVHVSVKDVAAQATAAGLTVREASGAFDTCGVEPVIQMKYDAFVNADPGDLSGPDAVTAVSAALAASGWTETKSGTGPEPWANLEKDGVDASVRLSKAEPGTLDIGVAHPCVDADREVIDALDKTREQISLD